MSARSIRTHMRLVRSITADRRPPRVLPFGVVLAAVLLALVLGRL